MGGGYRRRKRRRRQRECGKEEEEEGQVRGQSRILLHDGHRQSVGGGVP